MSWMKRLLCLGVLIAVCRALFTNLSLFVFPSISLLGNQLDDFQESVPSHSGEHTPATTVQLTPLILSPITSILPSTAASTTTQLNYSVLEMGGTTSPAVIRHGPRAYVPKVYQSARECSRQAFDLGAIETVEKCDALAADMPGCGDTIMFSKLHIDWHCRCCTNDSAEDGPPSEFWDVYTIQTPRINSSAAKESDPAVNMRRRECGKQAVSFGHIATAQTCDFVAAHTEECGLHFMFSAAHPEWGCRCCASEGSAHGPASPYWDVYNVLTPRAKVFQPPPTLPPVLHPFQGLPIATGRRPGWLAREDELVIDARNPGSRGGILVLQVVLMDAQSTWGKSSAARPHWLRAILATNRAHAKRHGHVMVLRAQPTQPQLTLWQWRRCGMVDKAACVKTHDRDNFNWEKHLMMSDYLLSSQNFTHILMLDADAAFVNRRHDTLRDIAATMDSHKKHLFITNEDWLKDGKDRINGGLMFAKNTNFTKSVFQDTFHAHLAGNAVLKNWRIGIPELECSSNEQICLNDLYQGPGRDYFASFTTMASGMKFNRGAEAGGELHIDDEAVEVMHWMGGSKATAGVALCGGGKAGHDRTGEGSSGYGCKL